ncbi:MFS transporter [Glutamicibacter protophormiae]|uniref:MFS transporter n=1 Tax=Glutamicibacter protophormiae TaxID=37930 RepID=UPI003A8FC14A
MTQATSTASRRVLTERDSINLIFLAAGISFASWAGRLSVIDEVFDFSGLTFGSFLLCMTAGTLLGISIIPTISRRFDTRKLLFYFPILLAACLVGLGISISVTRSPVTAFIILFINGIFFGCLDIMMNVSGARVERHRGRSLMPIFHGFFSLGTLLGAGLATATITLQMLTIWHFAMVAALLVLIAFLAQLGLAGWEKENYGTRSKPAGRSKAASNQKLGLLLLLGLMVAGLSFAEGAANDWIALATVSGHDLPHHTGALMFTLFVAAMTAGRFAGGKIVDNLGPRRTLLLMGSIGLVGICMFLVGHGPIVLGIASVMWGLGSSLGFPVGMTIAASQGSRLGPNAVSIISAFGYGAMLSGPPLIGFAVDHTGLPQALWIAFAVMLMSLLLSPRVTRTPAKIEGID